MTDVTNVPERGDILWLDHNPQSGHEQAGHRPALVISSAQFNRLGMAVMCPITSKAKSSPFEVPIVGKLQVTGVILANQHKSLDWKSRDAKFITKIDDETLNVVVGIIISIIDPDEVFGTSSESTE